jgi:excinuclease ABC subunit A
MANDFILIQGARQNNLKGLNLKLPLNELIVVTGVSGAGKSSLAFDTIYAEGQRRYVETFSPYARQFLERMDKPRADRIEGIPPSIAIDQTNPVRTSRSTVGTMTELNDHLKLLFARTAMLYCRGCGREVRRDTPESIAQELVAYCEGTPTALITFPVQIPKGLTATKVKALLESQGYIRIHREEDGTLEVIQDRVRLAPENRGRIVEDLEAALKPEVGRVALYPLDEQGRAGAPWRFSSDLHCPDCDIHYRDPVPNLFSFNSPIGACPTCRGFGRTIGVDYGLVVPDEGKTLAEGAVRPWQTESYRECQDDLLRFARKRGVPINVPWRNLPNAQRRWVLEGEGDWEDGLWYGASRFFRWLETKSYRMHIRVLLSKYRAYTLCPACRGARLKPEALLFRLGTKEDADHVLSPDQRFKPAGVDMSDAECAGLPGLCIHDVVCLPIERVRRFFEGVHLPAPMDEATELLFREVRARLAYLVEVGLGYLTLDRQSRTLSGGEAQRINLTTALGTSLVNTLFVLDEPSIGLHARDISRVIGVLRRLRTAGNTLVVVEHDPQVMLAADRILELGPGPGERGGEVVFFGTPRNLLQAGESLTAQYLSRKKAVWAEVGPQPPGTTWLEILGATENNLKGVDVRIPLDRLVCITGVSGSGKSTLVQDVLYRGLAKLKGKPVEAPGRHRAIRGHEEIRDVVLVDQSPIGRTARSNPASYVGAFDPIRRLFAAEPAAKSRGYTASTFSFNAGTGRCPTCAGSGFEHVEMQFLSDVYLRCPDCDGRRYRAEVLEVKLWELGGPTCPTGPTQGPALAAGRSIADVLDMTVAEALEFFAEHAEVTRALEPLAAVGLHYLRLGQPVPTLSGGEAQRLKLAGHLAETQGRQREARRTLFLLDEPTTGLHFDDIATLLTVFRRLLQAGHSLVVIEHNLEVIRAADWIIDLGPEGGEAGGEVVCAGSPDGVVASLVSHTGQALREYAREPDFTRSGGAARDLSAGYTSSHAIRVYRAREHNLKNIDLSIPRDRFTVITGVSGSGKSTLAFDVLFAEGQRRYLESLNAFARQYVQPVSRPDLDAVLGIPPTVAIEQRTSRGGRKSTVATQTEIYHFLRLLFVKLGTQHCPECGIPIEAQTVDAILAHLLRDQRGKRIQLLAPLVTARKGYYTDLAKWALGKGYSHLRVDGAMVPTANWPRLERFREHDIELPIGEITVTSRAEGELRGLLERAIGLGKGTVRVAGRVNGRERPASGAVFSTRRACPRCEKSFAELDPRLFSFNSKHGWCGRCYGTGLRLPGFDEDQTGEEIWWTDWWGGPERICPACHGRRLRPEALAVRFAERTISELTALSVEALGRFFGSLRLGGRAAAIAGDILPEIRGRLAFLQQVGLGYLTLDRSAPTLSGGEAQRLRLASQLGSNLRGVCYILDEPTIGLHPHDHQLLLNTLQHLQKKGNSVVVVEHDEATIRRAEHIVDLGPGAGLHGGRVVAEGTVADLVRNPESITGQYLRNPLPHPFCKRRPRLRGEPALSVKGARLHNLKNLDLGIPLGKLVCVTGVSGSGKSTLLREVIHDNVKHLLAGRSRARPAGCREIRGWNVIRRALEVDQTPIGKTPRSCPATYVGIWGDIRRLFAAIPEARLRGYGPGRFSFNVKGGRCESCEGQGVKKIEMSFLPDVAVTCEACGGTRFAPETLAVRYKDRTIADVLAMNVEAAVEFFANHARIHHALQLLQEVGLGYLTLGQSSPTLSGGEAQRIKLVTELAKARTPAAPLRRTRPTSQTPRDRVGNERHSLYVLDEPTIGLHMADVEKLVRVLHRLVDAGNTVLIIEHNLDVIAEADWVIDLGPDGGEGGGRIVARGTPEEIARVRRGSHTAKALAAFLRRHASGKSMQRLAAPESMRVSEPLQSVEENPPSPPFDKGGMGEF